MRNWRHQVVSLMILALLFFSMLSTLGTVITDASPALVNIYLESREIDGSTSNLGTIQFEPQPYPGYSLPTTISRETHQLPYYATYYPPSHHVFDHWETSGSITVPDPYGGPLTFVYVNGPGTLRAVYREVWSVTVDPNGGRIYVDGNPITASTIYSWNKGSTHTLDPDSGYSPSDGSKLFFTQWNDGNTEDPRTITVSATATYQAQWLTHYRLTIGVNPLDGGTTSPAVGSHWYNSGHSQAVSESPNSGYIFDHWDLDGNNVGSGTSYPVTMNGPHTLTAMYSVFVPDFDISISTYSLTVDQGKSATVTVTVEQVNGYSYDVSLSASGQPSGVTITYSPDHETPTFTSNMTIQVAYDVPANTYPIIVGGAGSDPESKTHERTFSLTVNKITFMTDSRLEVVPSSSYNTEILGVSVSFNMCSITPSTSNEDYRSAVYQHFGIILSGDAQHESMTMLEIHGLCDLADYLSQQWWSSWAFTSDFVSYIFGQHDTDGVARLAIVFRYSIDAEWITRSSIATLNLVKLLHGADDYSVDNLKNLLHEIANVFASTLELSFYHVFLTSPQDTKVIRSLSTSVIAQWAQEVNDFLDHAEPYTLILKIGLKLCKILLNIKDPVSLSFFIVTTAFEIADCLITLYFHDYFPETIVTIVHILASWDDPPELTADTQVFSESGDLVLGWNSTGGDFIDYSSAGFVMRDSNTQILFLKKIAPTTVGITAHGSSLDYIPYTLCIVDDYGNKSYVSSGLLSTNQSVNIGIDFVGNITEFGNHLIVEMNISTTTPIRGQLLTINIAVNDTAEPRADATVTLLINNATWVTADNLGYGQYQTIVDTSSMVGLIPIIVYADYSNMTTGYDAVILNVLSSPVGGIYVPVNKLQLLAPYIGLTTLLAVAVMTVAYVKKRKRNTEITS